MVIVYTISGGARAVAYTQTMQFVIIYLAMFLSAWYALKLLPEGIGITDAFHIGGKSGKLNVITTGMENGSFDWKDKYNIWSGIIGGFFLALSYFGTDQSQVGRYLTAKSVGQSRIGLLMNGIFKVPLQFFILLIGILVFVFYQFNYSPAYFNMANENKVLESENREEYLAATSVYELYANNSREASIKLSEAIKNNEEDEINILRQQMLMNENEKNLQRDSVRRIVKKTLPNTEFNDTNFIFLRFVGDNLPHGLIGLIIAIIFLASWGSVAAALNSLSGATMIDFHRKFSKKEIAPVDAYRWSKFYTLLWGIFCIVVAMFASNFGNSLIEAVNILGSWFYGTILGIFLVAFFVKYVKGTAVFMAAVAAEIIVIAVYRLDVISFLWLNLVGAAAVLFFAYLFQWILNSRD
jgi:Na+/proline symporter